MCGGCPLVLICPCLPPLSYSTHDLMLHSAHTENLLTLTKTYKTEVDFHQRKRRNPWQPKICSMCIIASLRGDKDLCRLHLYQASLIRTEIFILFAGPFFLFDFTLRRPLCELSHMLSYDVIKKELSLLSLMYHYTMGSKLALR